GSGAEPGAGALEACESRSRPGPATRTTATPTSRKTRSAAIPRPDGPRNAGSTSRCTVQQNNTVDADSKQQESRSIGVPLTNCKEKKDGESDSSPPSDEGKKTGFEPRGERSDSAYAGAQNIELRGNRGVPPVKDEELSTATATTTTWTEEMGIVFGKPVVKNAVRKQAQRSVETVKKPIFNAWSPTKLNARSSGEIENGKAASPERDNAAKLVADFRDTVIKNELDNQNAKIRAHLMPVLPDYRILNLLPTQIVQRLSSEPGRCCATVRDRAPPADRCKNWTYAKADVLEVPRLLEELAKLNVRADWPQVRAKLERVAELSLCKYPHAHKAKEVLRTLDVQMHSWPQDPLHANDLKKTIVLLEKAIGQIDMRPGVLSRLGNRLGTLHRAGILPSPAPQMRSPKTKSNQKALPIPSFSPYEPHNDYMQYLMKGTSYQAMSRIINTPLKDKDLDAKYMYIYWFKDKPDIIKIGVSHDVSRRLRSWEDKCGHKDCEHASDERLQYPIKHAFRVESLVHAAMKDVRCQTEKCAGCGVFHIEWFRTDVEVALKVIKCFAEFMNDDPYAFDREVGAVCLKRTEKVKAGCAEVLKAIDDIVRGKYDKTDARHVRPSVKLGKIYVPQRIIDEMAKKEIHKARPTAQTNEAQCVQG
ncbi:F-box protein: endocytic membrane traffic, recycling ReCYcling 1, partial [Ascosphaera pollenicola]